MRRAVVLSLAILIAASGCKKKPLSQNLNVENKVTVRPVTLFYEGPEMLLVREVRNVALPENPAGALSKVARELLNGSSNAGVPHIFPRDTVVRATFLLPDGTAFIDLGGPTLAQGWGTGSHEELMAVYSVVQTVTTNFPEAKRVRILINDEPAETLAGHVNLSRALLPSANYVAR
ncbi:MAG TPA: GerMN domain-containing protein [Thermoanaerobaculia bacterium]|nr:GerMN domain-containing protein [Thermoanaerobaculia bacterium]